MIMLKDVLMDNIVNTNKVHVYLKTYGKVITLAKAEAIDLLRILGEHIQAFECSTVINDDGVVMVIIEL